jgi:hypothetical protein
VTLRGRFAGQRLAGGLALGAWLVAHPVAAAPPSKQQCAEAYAETQSLRNAGKLRAARERALVCVQSSCPRIVTTDCIPWLAEIERSLPTVVLGARGPAGEDLTEVRVSMDGQSFVARLGGEALPVDPGEHTLRFEIDGSPPVEVKVVLRSGEKNRRIDASFAPPPPPPPPPPTPPGAPSPPPSVSPVVLALGGVAIVGLGVFATFGALGEAQKSNLEQTCAPRCSPDQASSVHTKLVVGDVGLFTAIAALAAGTTVFFVTRRAPPSAPVALRVEVAPAPWGGVLTARGSF